MTEQVTEQAAGLTLKETEKAAVLLLSMGENAAARVLQRLDRDDVNKVTTAMARLAGVSAESARGTLQEFFDLYRQQSGINSASREYLERTLDLALGEKLARGLLDSMYGDVVRQEIQRLQWVQPELLARFLQQEHPQMQAVILAFLPADSAAAVLSLLPADSHDELLLRVANLNEVSEFVVVELKAALARCMEFVAHNAGARVDGVRQVADIVNRYQGNRGELMESIKLHNAEKAGDIERNMYDFTSLARQTQETLQRIVQDLPLEVLGLALKGAESPVRRVMLEAMPRRMAQQMEQDMLRQGAVAVSRVENARQDVMNLVRDLVEQGELEFQLYEEQVVN
ncbi:FliG C-terminal domain-containing protein [Oceanimonas sp. CHS3-5]|uniref:FliG C-terminal domain-containing protein n=1 Tax=Oceanimonas sp. CHS3-5 TaxID=3068186 RepID=UPI00273F55EF|nr:FliG C-terminal domain-containing protein [Oceanimonas sp. CHS3-5]MDP5292398.1 FliG C-terminal domain-containing protein [Oceanimonas sp. CHS3-5]